MGSRKRKERGGNNKKRDTVRGTTRLPFHDIEHFGSVGRLDIIAFKAYGRTEKEKLRHLAGVAICDNETRYPIAFHALPSSASRFLEFTILTAFSEENLVIAEARRRQFFFWNEPSSANQKGNESPA